MHPRMMILKARMILKAVKRGKLREKKQSDANGEDSDTDSDNLESEEHVSA